MIDAEHSDRPRHLPPRRPRGDRPLISLVVPCYREEETVAAFVREIDAALPDERIEFVFVNDGSPDATLSRLLRLAETDRRLRIVNLSRNFGKEAALTAGLDHAVGDVVLPMDVDLQDPPHVIGDMLSQWRRGYDVVVGRRVDRRSDTRAKRVTSAIFYRVFNWVSSTRIPENVGDFRLLDRRVVDAIQRLPERSRFMKGLFAWVGFPTATVDYIRPERLQGETSFNFWKLWRLAVDGVINFSSIPLRIWTYVGSFVAFMAFSYGSFIILRTLVLGRDTPGYASILTIILFFGGIQLITLGIMGEYLARLFVETKSRPIYLVEGLYGGGAAAGSSDHDVQTQNKSD